MVLMMDEYGRWVQNKRKFVNLESTRIGEYMESTSSLLRGSTGISKYSCKIRSSQCAELKGVEFKMPESWKDWVLAWTLMRNPL